MSRLLDRLRSQQSGFTLIELLVSMSVGMVVLAAVMLLMDSGAHSATRTSDRVELTQRGRAVTNAIQKVLRSQVCLDDSTPPISYGDRNIVQFYTDTDADPLFVPAQHKIQYLAGYKGGRGEIIDQTSSTTQTASQGPPWTLDQVKNYLLAEDVTLIPGKPFLTYYSWNLPSAAMSEPLSTTNSGASVPLNSEARVTHIQVNFRLRPQAATNNSSGSVGNQNDPSRDGDVSTDVYVRNSDYYTDTDAKNRVWGPRCG